MPNPNDKVISNYDPEGPIDPAASPFPPRPYSAYSVLQSGRLHPSTFDYLKPTEEHLRTMTMARRATSTYASMLESLLPDGPDKTYVMRKVREIGMWANVAITRFADGTPRG